MPRTLSSTYSAVHQWVRRNWGHAKQCQHCRKEGGRLSWASKHGKMTRLKKDWMQLCYSCHKKYDNKRLGVQSWNKGKRKVRSILICEWCAKSFTPKRVGQIFCSRLCTGRRNGNRKKHLAENNLIDPTKL